MAQACVCNPKWFHFKMYARSLPSAADCLSVRNDSSITTCKTYKLESVKEEKSKDIYFLLSQPLLASRYKWESSTSAECLSVYACRRTEL